MAPKGEQERTGPRVVVLSGAKSAVGPVFVTAENDGISKMDAERVEGGRYLCAVRLPRRLELTERPRGTGFPVAGQRSQLSIIAFNSTATSS